MNPVILLAAVLAGAVVIDYGVKSTKTAFAATGTSITPTAAPAAGTVGAGGPFPTGTPVQWGRTDQGVDADAPAGTPIAAIVSGTVSAIIPNWYNGQPAVFVDSPGLPGGATGIYYAEQLTPDVHVGDAVQAGQPIGTVAASGTGLEFGLASGTSTLARVTGGYVEGEATHAGDLMHEFLAGLGVKF